MMGLNLLFFNSSLIEEFCLSVGLQNIPNDSETIEESGLSLDLKTKLLSLLEARASRSKKSHVKVKYRIPPKLLFAALWVTDEIQSNLTKYHEAVRLSKSGKSKNFRIVNINGLITWNKNAEALEWMGDLVVSEKFFPSKEPPQILLKFNLIENDDSVPLGLHGTPVSVITFWDSGFKVPKKTIFPIASVLAVVAKK